MEAWYSQTVKSVADRFFKLNFMNVNGKSTIGWWLAVFYWAKP